jgi:hypothetical protein
MPPITRFDGEESHLHIGAGDSSYFPNVYTPAESEQFEQALPRLEYVPHELLTFNMYGKVTLLPRRKAFYGTVDAISGHQPLYRYGGTYRPTVQPWTPELDAIRARVNTLVGEQPNHAVINQLV